MAKLTVTAALLLLTTASVASSGPIVTALCTDFPKLDKTLDNRPICAPEIDPSSAMAAGTLLLGALAVVRGRRSKKDPKQQ
jgi:MYXO-CTERM domain-containing protein